MDAERDTWARLAELRTQAAAALLEASRLTRSPTITVGGDRLRLPGIEFSTSSH